VAEAAAEPQAPERARLPLELELEPHSDLAVSPLDEGQVPAQPAQGQVPEQPAQEQEPKPAEAPPPVRALPVVQPARRAAAPAHDLRHRRPTAAR